MLIRPKGQASWFFIDSPPHVSLLVIVSSNQEKAFTVIVKTDG